jgi:ribosomal protein S6--L-glutamate ligase
MAIGILYESKEWSSYALERNINSLGIPAELIDMQKELYEEKLLSFSLIVNRVFASAVFRGHHLSHRQTRRAIALLKKAAIPMINPSEAHYYETSKELSTKTLAAHGFQVPEIYGVYRPARIVDAGGVVEADGSPIKYPCIVKPDCGGRTNYTYVVNNYGDLCRSMENTPDINYIAEEYANPEYGYITRIEVIGRECKLILKRSVTGNGLSAYHLGSTYTAYRDCPAAIKDAAIRAMDILQIEAGSMDIIENRNGFYIIDVNSVSNASEDNTEMFSFDLMKETAAYVAKKYGELKCSAYT